MSKTLSQYTTTKSLKPARNSRKNLLRLALILITIMLGLLFVSQLFDSQGDGVVLTDENKIVTGQQILTSICNEKGLSCPNFPEKWGMERNLTTTEIDWCNKANVVELNKCTNLFNYMDALDEFARIVNNYNL